jgi:hypothetical protein
MNLLGYLMVMGTSNSSTGNGLKILSVTENRLI